MEHLKALKFFIARINQATKEGLKGVDCPQKLFIIAEHLSETINHENLKIIVKEAEKERRGLEWKREKDAATKLINKYKLYKSVAYETETLKLLTERLKKFNPRDCFGDTDLMEEIAANYRIFKNWSKDANGYGTASKAVAVLNKYYTEIYEVTEPMRQKERAIQERIRALR